MPLRQGAMLVGGTATKNERAAESMSVIREEMAKLATRLRIDVEQNLLSGDLSADGVARHLAISRQTLHRHLREEDCCFSELLTQVRRQHALQRLQQPDCRIEALSRELGFSEPSAFYKAFKGWFGLSPKAYQQHAGS